MGDIRYLCGHRNVRLSTQDGREALILSVPCGDCSEAMPFRPRGRSGLYQFGDAAPAVAESKKAVVDE